MKLKLTIFCLLVSSVCAFSQGVDLPGLSDDKAVKTDMLPNGIRYYLDYNPSDKGMLNIAVVQKMDASIDEPRLQAMARDRFSRVKLGKTSLESFLGRNGTVPDGNGYITVKKGSIQYDFVAISTARSEAVTDSTLWAVFNLIDVSSRMGQVSSSQAVILAGDFDSSAMLSKMRLISLINQKVDGSIPDFEYEWVPPATRTQINFEGGESSKVVVRLRGARIPQKYLKTVLPVVSKKMAEELGWVLKSRLYPVFRSRGIHVWINYAYESSSDSISDETITLTVYCIRKSRGEVRDILEEEMSRLFTYGVDEVEYTYARDAYRYRWLSESKNPIIPNSSLVKHCASAFLYGTALASENEKFKFAYRDVPDSVQTRLFNKYLVRMMARVADADSSLAKAPSLVTRERTDSAFAAFAPVATLKLPKDKTEYMTGGYFWTFPNGVNVIYKRMDTKGLVYYSYASKGGRKWADPDYFTCIDGVYEESFTNYLASLGIDMKVNLNATDVRLEGTVPQENLCQMLNVLCALSQQKENKNVFSSKCYKLMVVVGDMDPLAFKKLMASYVTALMPGSSWTAGTSVEEYRDLYTFPGTFTVRTVVAPLDVSTSNLALTDIAAYALNDAMGAAMAGHALKYVSRRSFVGFSSSRYTVEYGVRQLALENFSLEDTMLPESEKVLLLSRVMDSLSASPVSPSSLAAYKGMARNAYLSYKTTPRYFVEIASNRYLDNKDLYSKYLTILDKVSAGDLQAFFASFVEENPE